MQINSSFSAQNTVLASRPIEHTTFHNNGEPIDRDYIDLNQNGQLDMPLNWGKWTSTEPTLDCDYNSIKKFGQEHGLSVVTEGDFKTFSASIPIAPGYRDCAPQNELGRVPGGETATRHIGEFVSFSDNSLNGVASSLAPSEINPPQWGFDISNDTFLVYKPK